MRDRFEMTSLEVGKEHIFKLHESHICTIRDALLLYLEDISDTLDSKKLEKDGIEIAKEEHNIADPLYEWFKQFSFLIEGIPESEPVLTCQYSLKALRMNHDDRQETTRRNQRLKDLGDIIKK